MISEAVYKKVKNDVIVRIIDKIVVKGKTEPIEVYELLGLKNDSLAIEKYNLLQDYIAGYNHFTKKDFIQAKEYFQKSLTIHPNDKLSQIYLERAENYILNPPGKNWLPISYLTKK